MSESICAICAKAIPAPAAGDISTGYGLDAAGDKVCFTCCGMIDKAEMILTGRATLYLTYDRELTSGRQVRVHNAAVTNWPGTMKIRAAIRSGRHNIAGRRYDVWFTFAGRQWHGVNYGENSQVCHCKVNKRDASGRLYIPASVNGSAVYP